MDASELIQSNSLTKAAPGGKQQILGKDDFLKIMLLQLQNQDPLNPMDNQAMTAQMAQFSSLEAMNNLNSSFSSAQAVNSFTNATQLLGKVVQINDPASDPTNPKPLATQVTSVSYTSSGPQLGLANGLTTSLDQVQRVFELPQQ